MSNDALRHGSGGLPPALDTVLSSGGPGRKTRRRRGPTPGELALLRWLAVKPRPVIMGPIGNCVKRGWCEPVRAVVDDDDGRRLGFIYVVTEAGAQLIGQPAPGDVAEAGRYAAGAAQPDNEEGGDRATERRSRSAAIDPKGQ